MPRTHPYPPEYRQQIADLVRAGRRPEELAREFEPTAHTIQNWVKQADRDEGHRHDGLTTAERQELARLRRDLREAASPGTGDPGKSGRLVRAGDRLDPTRIFEFVSANRATYPVATMCRAEGGRLHQPKVLARAATMRGGSGHGRSALVKMRS
jgi:hypothetical protein